MIKKEKSKFKNQILWQVILPLLILISVLILILNSQNKKIGARENPISQLSQCLNNNGWTMYGDNSCEYCQQQKSMFGSAFNEINYIDCGVNAELCQKKGISKYPVWEKDGKKYYGVYNLKDLSAYSGCKYQ